MIYAEKTFNVGDTLTYPGSDWHWVVKVPEHAAIEWATEIAAKAHISGRTDKGVREVRLGKAQWLNKLALVIEVDRGILALYYHDTDFWLIQKRD